MTWPRIGLVTTLLIVVTGCTSGDASSPAPDADASPTECPTWVPDPALARDEVLDVHVLHVPTTVVVELHQRDIVPSLAQSWDLSIETPGATWTVDVFRTRERHRTHTEAWLDVAPAPPPADGNECGLYAYASTPRPCPGLEADVAPYGDTVQVVIPRDCLETPDWVSVSAQVSDGDHEPYTTSEPGPRVPVS